MSSHPVTSSASNPGHEDPHARRRRTSVSGKLFSLFSSKSSSKPPAQPCPSRPVISHPQPLERRIPPRPRSVAALLSPQPIRKKRDYREASLDENHGVVTENTSDVPTRATSRPRLDSNAARTTLQPQVTPADARSQPVLKSALKKPASQPSQTKGARFEVSHTTRAKEALQATTVHNRAAPAFVPLSEPLVNHGDAQRQNSALSPSTLPHTSTSANHTRATASSHKRDSSTKKTVTFADDTSDGPMVGLKRTRTMRDINADQDDDHWTHLVADIDALDTSDPLSPRQPSALHRVSTAQQPSASPKGPRRPQISPRRKSDPTVFTAPATAARGRKAAPAKSEAEEHEEFRTLLARQAPPTPVVTLKRDPFRLPPAATKGRGDAGQSSRSAMDKENVQSERVGASGFLEKVLKEIARDKEEREQERAVPTHGVPRPTLPTSGRPMSVLRRFKVDIVPIERHTTIWDGCDTDIYAWHGTLEIHDMKPASYFYPRHAIHDVSIRFHTVAEPREDPSTFDGGLSPSSSPPEYEWQTTYTGHRLPPSPSTSPQLAGPPPALNPIQGIALAHAPHLAPGNDPDGPCTWRLDFWVPVPVRLFARGAEHRTFVCRASVTVRDWETPRTVVPGGCVAVGIERLRTTRLLAGGGARAVL
ncbi:hypothetical protein C8Q77DRAFT_1045673 [Trametes polyzona]|nr:hypothetical protein C8Q77DRAFT_1045673 [Trametes polyzona]